LLSHILYIALFFPLLRTQICFLLHPSIPLLAFCLMLAKLQAKHAIQQIQIYGKIYVILARYTSKLMGTIRQRYNILRALIARLELYK
jgi:hypothetical protein